MGRFPGTAMPTSGPCGRNLASGRQTGPLAGFRQDTHRRHTGGEMRDGLLFRAFFEGVPRVWCLPVAVFQHSFHARWYFVLTALSVESIVIRLVACPSEEPR